MDERGRSRQVGVRRVAVAGVALAVASALGAARDARAEEAPSGAYVAVGVAGVFDQTGIDFDSGVGADVRVGGFLSEYVRLEAEYAYTGDLERSFGFFGRLEARAHTATVNLRVGLPSEVVSPFVVAGVGLATIGAGVGLGVYAQSRADAAATEPVQTTAVDVHDGARGLATAANVVLVAGAALAIVGATWIGVRWLGPSQKALSRGRLVWEWP